MGLANNGNIMVIKQNGITINLHNPNAQVVQGALNAAARNPLQGVKITPLPTQPLPVVSRTHQQPTNLLQVSPSVVQPQQPSPNLVTVNTVTQAGRQTTYMKVKKRGGREGRADGYKPDNNSNNVIELESIQPPPSEEERKKGFCHRKMPNGQNRLICIVCGKHYTTMYNMRQHRNIHTGKGLHTCRFCGRSFTHKHIWEVRTKAYSCVYEC